MDYFPLISCILVGTCLIACCIRNRNRNQYINRESREQEYQTLPSYEPVHNTPFVLPPIILPAPSAPPMPTTQEEADPIV